MLRRLYEQEFDRHPTAQAARDLGLFLSRHGDKANARRALAEALRLDDENGPAEAPGDAFDLALVSPLTEAEPLLKRASESTDTELAARAFDTLGHLYDAKGDKPSAVESYRRAIALREAPNILEALAQDLEPAQGIPLVVRALALSRRDLGARHPQTATTEANLAGLLLNAGRVEESITAARDALSIFEATLGPDQPRTATVATILADGLRAKGDRVGAERYYRRALDIDRAAYGPDHPRTLSDERALADFLRQP